MGPPEELRSSFELTHGPLGCSGGPIGLHTELPRELSQRSRRRRELWAIYRLDVGMREVREARGAHESCTSLLPGQMHRSHYLVQEDLRHDSWRITAVQIDLPRTTPNLLALLKW